MKLSKPKIQFVNGQWYAFIGTPYWSTNELVIHAVKFCIILNSKLK